LPQLKEQNAAMKERISPLTNIMDYVSDLKKKKRSTFMDDI